jgi:hypothetical protein
VRAISIDRDLEAVRPFLSRVTPCQIKSTAPAVEASRAQHLRNIPALGFGGTDFGRTGSPRHSKHYAWR